MSVNEAYLGFVFFRGLLTPDVTLQGYAPGGGYRAMAPSTTTPPFWVMSLQSPGVDTTTQQGVRLLCNPLFQVRVVGPEAMSAQIASGAERIDVLLGGKDGLRNQNITGGFIAACIRESVLQTDTLVNGELSTSIGGLYRLIIEQTT